ncbi:DoxX family protein [Pedobacter sp. BS3]|uniref:DoxX family protein n=1 Tax=Pedobacter sp. BS3 TaxID=2567937 RepID=UPI0011EDB988|nr:DoxX family protein [Pedobacter sp. BS3]TZF84477.1 DoxX family protein [Pedobacter sp. BS3]
MKRIKTIYWVFTIIFAIMMLLDGYGGVTQQEAGKEAFRQLGYPIYLLSFIGITKILGAAALVQPMWPRLKEWAFAGFAFSFIGAAVSWACSNGPVGFIIFPLVMLTLLIVWYVLWKKYERVRIE